NAHRAAWFLAAAVAGRRSLRFGGPMVRCGQSMRAGDRSVRSVRAIEAGGPRARRTAVSPEKIARAGRRRRDRRRTSMPKDVYQFPCPCCGKQIEVDTRSGKARAVLPGEAKGGQDLDRLLQAQRRDAERLGSAFDTARQDQEQQGQQLDKLLKKAKDDAKQKPDEKLRLPFDFD